MSYYAELRKAHHGILLAGRPLREACAEVDRLRKIIELRNDHDERQLQDDSIVASCGCGVKTPEVKYHKPECKYRLVCERDDARSALKAATGWRPISTVVPGLCIFRYENNGKPFSTHGVCHTNGVLEDHAEMQPERPTHWLPLQEP